MICILITHLRYLSLITQWCHSESNVISTESKHFQSQILYNLFLFISQIPPCLYLWRVIGKGFMACLTTFIPSEFLGLNQANNSLVHWQTHGRDCYKTENSNWNILEGFGQLFWSYCQCRFWSSVQQRPLETFPQLTWSLS